jgi:hypothetical protein
MLRIRTLDYQTSLGESLMSITMKPKLLWNHIQIFISIEKGNKNFNTISKRLCQCVHILGPLNWGDQIQAWSDDPEINLATDNKKCRYLYKYIGFMNMKRVDRLKIQTFIFFKDYLILQYWKYGPCKWTLVEISIAIFNKFWLFSLLWKNEK